MEDGKEERRNARDVRGRVSPARIINNENAQMYGIYRGSISDLPQI